MTTMTTVVIHGSVLTTPAAARDVDAIYVGDRDVAERVARGWAGDHGVGVAHTTLTPPSPLRDPWKAPQGPEVSDVEPEKGGAGGEYDWCLEYEVNIPYDVEPELPMTEPEDCGRVTVRPA